MGVFDELILTEKQLHDRARYWLTKLNLNHWEVCIGISRKSNMPIKDASGACKWNLHQALAWIVIIDPLDYPCEDFKFDMEVTLVHELLHLHFAPFDTFSPDTLEDIMKERAVEHIARTLVELDRKGKKVNEAIHSSTKKDKAERSKKRHS